MKKRIFCLKLFSSFHCFFCSAMDVLLLKQNCSTMFQGLFSTKLILLKLLNSFVGLFVGHFVGSLSGILLGILSGAMGALPGRFAWALC